MRVVLLKLEETPVHVIANEAQRSVVISRLARRSLRRRKAAPRDDTAKFLSSKPTAHLAPLEMEEMGRGFLG